MTVSDIIAGLIEREGDNYTDDPVDHGGPTRYGVTLATLSEFRGAPMQAADVRALTRLDAAVVYQQMYVYRSGFLHILDERVQVMLIDWAVNSGIGTATMALQRLLGVTVDGRCGPVTLGAANARDPVPLLKALGLARQRFCLDIVLHDPLIAPLVQTSQIRFLRGWLARNWAVSVDPL